MLASSAAVELAAELKVLVVLVVLEVSVELTVGSGSGLFSRVAVLSLATGARVELGSDVRTSQFKATTTAIATARMATVTMLRITS